MTFIIPMAGKGSRFIKQGYTKPKYMIEVKGKTLFEYSMESLPVDIADKLIFICLREHEKFQVTQFIKTKINHKNIKIIYLDKVTQGQAQTVMSAKDEVSNKDGLLIYNIDTYFYSSNLKSLLKDNKYDGILGAFVDISEDDKWSFAKVDKDGKVILTTEKEKISNNALTGLYYFKYAKDFFDISKKWINNAKTIRGEFYIAPMYNDLISQNKQYILDIVDEFIPLGTPQEVKDFEQKC